MSVHAWCRDIERDEAVRAAEDGRSGPLPTLEEAIADPFTKTARIRETETAVEPAIPAADAQGGGVAGLRTERVTLEVTHDVAGYPLASWDWRDILRCARYHRDVYESVRVVEEVHFDDLANMSLERDAAIRERGELRDKLNRCPECNGEGKHDSGGTDASGEWINLPCEGCDSTGTMHGYVEATDKLRTRVASLESQLESVACRAATAEMAMESAPAARRLYDIGHKISPFMTFSSGPDGCIVEIKFKSLAEGQTFHDAMVKFFTTAPAASVQTDEEDADIGYALRLFVDGRRVLSHELDRQQAGAFLIAADYLAKYLRTEYQAQFDESAPAASGAAGTEVVSSEVVGYAVKQGKFYSQHLHANYGDAWGVAGKGTVVPLYATPPAASGWLTAEEREAIEWAADAAYDKQHPAEDTLRALLARSTPPEVVLPRVYCHGGDSEPLVDLEDVRAALAAAGVTVKEVK